MIYAYLLLSLEESLTAYTNWLEQRYLMNQCGTFNLSQCKISMRKAGMTMNTMIA
jgi:hypothetical protein